MQTIGGHAEGLRVGLSEHLAIADTAGRVGVATLDETPEILGYVVVPVLSVSLVDLQGADNHGDVLIGVAGADVVDVAGERLVELWGVKTSGSLEQLGRGSLVRRHLGDTRERFADAADLASDIHVPHLVAVAGSCAAFVLRAVFLDVGSVVHAVPHPETHVFCNEQSLVGNLGVVKIGGDVDKSGEHFMDGVVWRPHPVAVIIWPVGLDKDAMLRWYGIKIAISVVFRMFLVFVEGSPRAFKVTDFSLGSKVARLAVASEVLVEDEGSLLALAQLVDNPRDILAEDRLLLGVFRHGVGLRYRAHVVACAVAFEFGVGRIPAVGDGIAVGWQSIGVAKIVDLLRYVP